MTRLKRGKITPEERNALCTEHLGIVIFVAQSMGRPRWMDRDDVIAEGTLGLLRAAELFDPSLGIQFSTFAEHRIRGAIRDYMRDSAWGKRTATKDGDARRKMLTAGELRDGWGPGNGRARTSFWGEDDLCFARVSAAHDARIVLDYCEPPRLRAVLEAHYMNGLGLREIGDAIGVSESRVCQLLREARKYVTMRMARG